MPAGQGYPGQQPAGQGGGGGGSETFMEGHRGSGRNRGIKGARNRLWSNEFGGGFVDRQFLDPGVMQQMQQQAMGQAPSAAEQLMRAGLAQQQQQAYGLAASGQGMSPGLAMQQAQQAAGQAGLQSQGQFGAMRAEEMARAQQTFTNAQLQGQGLNDAAGLAREQLLNQLVQAQFAGKGSGFDWQAFGAQAGGGLAGGAMKAGITALMSMSDPAVKHDIHVARAEVDQVLRALEPLSFAYNWTSKKQLGIVTRDLKKTSLGSAVVRQTAAGEAIDVRDGLSLVLAAVARLNQRLDDMERRLG